MADERVLQLSFPPDRFLALERIKNKAHLNDYNDLFNNALALFDWALTQRAKGEAIASVDDHRETYRVVSMRVLDQFPQTQKAVETQSKPSGLSADNKQSMRSERITLKRELPDKLNPHDAIFIRSKQDWLSFRRGAVLFLFASYSVILSATLSIFFLQGFRWKGFLLSDTIIDRLAVATIGEVACLGGIVYGALFKKSETPNPTPPIRDESDASRKSKTAGF